MKGKEGKLWARNFTNRMEEKSHRRQKDKGKRKTRVELRREEQIQVTERERERESEKCNNATDTFCSRCQHCARHYFSSREKAKFLQLPFHIVLALITSLAPR